MDTQENKPEGEETVADAPVETTEAGQEEATADTEAKTEEAAA